MNAKYAAVLFVLGGVLSPLTLRAQSSQPSVSVPRVINVSGVYQPADGTPPPAGTVVTLSVYADQDGGAPLWQETQNITLDKAGRFTVLLGATQRDGIPLDIFASGDLFDHYWHKLLRSYAVEALARPTVRAVASREGASEFLRRLNGRETMETEPGVYRWSEISEGHLAEIELEALSPKPMKLHRLLLHRTS